MPDPPLIDAATFRDRLAALCTRPRPQLPRKLRDRHVLLRSVCLLLQPDGVYSEPAINAAIQDWLRRVAADLHVDHVAIRRELVDRGYLRRTADGAAYLVDAGAATAFGFAAEVATLDPVTIVAERRQRIATARAEAARRGVAPPPSAG